MDNIIITEYNDILSPTNGYKKEDKLPTGPVGIHKVCGGFVDKLNTSNSHMILFCRHCKLRVVVPNTIKTFKDLIEFYRKGDSK